MSGDSDLPYNAMSGAADKGPVKIGQSQGDRLHFLDWIRVLLVTAVVYGHTSLMGLPGGLPVASNKVIDDRVWNFTDPSPMGVRPLAVARSFGLPLLFWISGASSALSFRGKLKGLSRLAIYGAIGVGLNAAIWFVGPQETICAPFSSHEICEKQGWILNFTIVPMAGNIFPILFQMWYILVLLIFLVLNWPLMAVLHGSGRLWYVVLQWIGSSAVYVILIKLAGTSCTNPVGLIAILASTEAFYLLIVSAAAPVVRDSISRKLGSLNWQRAHQYIVALVGLLQFSATPIADRIDSISALFILFIFINFSKFFVLGFLVTKARESGQVLPLVSNIWPLAFWTIHWFLPSTNWYLAGNLTYPYFERLSDRITYGIYGTMLIFCTERAGLTMKCMPVPPVLTTYSLMVYLIHPLVLTILISFGLKDVATLYWLTIAIIFSAVALGQLKLKGT